MHLASNGYVGLCRVEEGKVNVCGLFRLDSKLSGKGAQTLERYMRAGGLDGLAARVFSANVDLKSFLGVAGISFGSSTGAQRNRDLGRRMGNDSTVYWQRHVDGVRIRCDRSRARLCVADRK